MRWKIIAVNSIIVLLVGVLSYALLDRLELRKVEHIVIRDGNDLYVCRQHRFAEDVRRNFSRRRITGLTLFRVRVYVDFHRCFHPHDVEPNVLASGL